MSMPTLGSIDNVNHYNYNILLTVTFTRKTVVRKLTDPLPTQNDN